MRNTRTDLDVIRSELRSQHSTLKQELEDCGRTLRSCSQGVARDDIVDEDCQMLTLRMEQLRCELFDVEGALDQLAAGGYGTCQECARRIPVARLRANPMATRCRDCQDRYDRGAGSFHSNGD